MGAPKSPPKRDDRFKGLTAPLLFLCALFLGLQTLLANKVHETIDVVVDELFHTAQGLEYCKGNYERWDPKITTLPGLYVWSSLLCAPIGKCTAYCMRYSSVIGSIVNFVLFAALSVVIARRDVLDEKEWTVPKILLQSMNLFLFPPLYFFSQFYYTDTISVAAVLVCYLFTEKGRYFTATVFGFLAVCVRQTNIVYVGLFAALRLSGLLINYTVFKRSKEPTVSEEDLSLYVRHQKSKLLRRQLPSLPIFDDSDILSALSSFLLLFLAFVTFVVVNGGVVVGDKEAHVATLHLVQIGYFALFSVFFAWPHLLSQLPPMLRSLRTHLNRYIVAAVLTTFVVRYTTVVHPYLLADNRHYVFYVWRRFFATPQMRFAWTPVYLSAGYVLWRRVYAKRDVCFAYVFVPVYVAALCLQSLFEVRYFIIPYVVMRLQYRGVSYKALLTEFFFYATVNVLTFYVFFTKTVTWTDFAEPQRIIW